ncbi:DUF5808 domain-containing protein [Paenibacillus xylaniclasticus]|uniref:DUF5808 domain-containing protein n=1 Tax=Paenibacillus xylaniclasticus TaxID=588083 RepID=UPI0017778065|nr:MULTISPECIES: DUF5808 domain-containing protein [Paenibacillus]GFN31471.1 hypothetical protein PCURB6_17310 [Paenibacillus curdlanolyticus]
MTTSFMLVQFIPIIVLYTVFWVTYWPLANYKNGMLFAVTLPEHAIEHPAIDEIRSRFRKQFIQWSVGLGVAVIPLAVMNIWDKLLPYSTIYFLMWIVMFILGMAVPSRRAFISTLSLKREQEWFVGKKNVVHSDLRVARLKNAKSAPLSLFAIPLAMSVGTLLMIMRDDEVYSGIAYTGIGVTLLFLLSSFYMRRAKAKVYSADSDINLSLNQARRRTLSYLMLLLAIVENVHFLLICLFLTDENSDMSGLWITITMLFSIAPVAILLMTYRRIRAREQEILEQDGKVIYSDDDEYWANGFTYHNPHDRALFVEKRVGVGLTINTGTLAGKIIAGGLIGILAGTIIVVSFLLIRSELTSPVLTLTADRQVEINYPMYNYDFPISAIEQLDLVDEVPIGVKTSGEATARASRGKFSLSGLGSTRLYIYKNNPPYIRIKLSNTYIFFNDQDPEQTKRIYEQLKNSLQQ